MVFVDCYRPALRNKERGVAAIEFALVLVLFITILVGVVGFGSMFWMQQRLSETAGEGARAVMYGRFEGRTDLAALACAPANAVFAGTAGLSCSLIQAPCSWSATGSIATCGAVAVRYDVSQWPMLAGLRALIGLLPLSGAQDKLIPSQLSARANVQIWQGAS